jgi:hypothetical protein
MRVLIISVTAAYPSVVLESSNNSILFSLISFNDELESRRNGGNSLFEDDSESVRPIERADIRRSRFFVLNLRILRSDGFDFRSLREVVDWHIVFD